MWKRHIGIKKSHYYPPGRQKMSAYIVAACGVTHASSRAIPESSDTHRCKECVKAYETAMGLFA